MANKEKAKDPNILGQWDATAEASERTCRNHHLTGLGGFRTHPVDNDQRPQAGDGDEDASLKRFMWMFAKMMAGTLREMKRSQEYS